MSQTAYHPTTIYDISFGPLLLTSGDRLENVTLRYQLTGPPDAPVILVCHALTGNHHTTASQSESGWWDGLVGPSQYIDTNDYQILTFNALGGCDGSTGPTSTIPGTRTPYQADFPAITVRDMVHAQHMALKKLGITELKAVIGGSLGGMQVMEWGLLYPTFMEKLVILAATPVFSSYGIAFNHIAASNIKHDPDWKGGYYKRDDLPLKGLEMARMVGMVTYRTPELFRKRFDNNGTPEQSDVMSYLNYQGKKLSNRFDPNSYLSLLETMNSHDIGLERGGWKQAASSFQRPILILSFENDLIYEPETIKTFASTVPRATYHHIQTDFGHDGFLTEFEKWGSLIADFL